jgi:hypothetical protein
MLNSTHLVELLPVGLLAMPPVMLLVPKPVQAAEKLGRRRDEK